MTKKMRSKANPRSLVFTIGFSAESACRGQGTKTKAKPMQRFFIDIESGKACDLHVAQRPLTKGVPLAPGDTAVTGDPRNPTTGP